MKKIIILGMVVLMVVGMGAMSFADTDTQTQRNMNIDLNLSETFEGTIDCEVATDTEKLANLEAKKVQLQELVDNGTITQGKADFMIERMSQMTGEGSQKGTGHLNQNPEGRGNKGVSKGQGNRVVQ